MAQMAAAYRGIVEKPSTPASQGDFAAALVRKYSGG